METIAQEAKRLLSTVTEEGYVAGEICNRNGCQGVIKEKDTDSCCSCHQNAPCSHCTTSREYCPDCGWDGREEQIDIDKANEPTQDQKDKWAAEREEWKRKSDEFDKKLWGKEKATEFDYRVRSHTHFSQKVEGVYPDSMTDKDVIEWVKKNHYNQYFGGGRWEKYPSNGIFIWIQYTD